MITLILIALCAICSAFMDVSAVFFTTSKLKNLNPLWWDWNRSWVGKWKNGDRNQGEKFFGSSTFLVFLTDAWHFFKTIMILSYCIAPLVYSPIFGIYDFAIFFIVHGLVFEGVYRYLKS